MAVPSSGTLSLRGIRRELEDNNYNSGNSYTNISLKNCSDGTVDTINTANASADRPDGSAPHAMSEFYSYDHDLTNLTSFSVGQQAGSDSEACLGTATNTYYHDGTGTYPAVNDTVYSNSGGTQQPADGFYKVIAANQSMQLQSGVVQTLVSCARGRSARSLKTNVNFVGTSTSGIPIYHFEYINKNHGEGVYVGTMIDDLLRLGRNDAIINNDGDLFVDYDKLDVDFKRISS